MGKRQRDWFHKMAPKGFRIRMMEPGEASALFDILKAASGRFEEVGRAPPDLVAVPLETFVRWLLQHEIFVATTKAGEPVGFAAARDLVDLYWLSGLYVLPGRGRLGVGRALLDAVLRRAGWFFHRAVGLTTYRDIEFNELLFRRCGFMTVLRKDFPAILEDRFLCDKPEAAEEEDRVVMVKWL